MRIYILPELGRLRLDAIATDQVDLLIARLKRLDRAPKTLNNILSVLRTCLFRAREWGIIRHLPKINWVEVTEQPILYLTIDEMTMRYVHIDSTEIAETAAFIETVRPVPWARVHQVSTKPVNGLPARRHRRQEGPRIGSTNTKADLTGRPT